jgi:hypothetical protein
MTAPYKYPRAIEFVLKICQKPSAADQAQRARIREFEIKKDVIEKLKKRVYGRGRTSRS